MNLLNFTSNFPEEDSCKAKFKEYREQTGVVCP
ncbi:MAG: IS1595 family transposase, partial [Tannerella sp.]|nr:IS1595 family transposase [Tannerella sp.]MDR2148801.1 IS1595 family transposase [Tannerella sp.]